MIKYPYNNKYKRDYQQYKLMSIYANDLLKIFYENNKSNKNKNLFKLSCIINIKVLMVIMQCSINTVVFEIQKGEKNLNLNSINYLCTIIENLGDFNKSMKNITSDKEYIKKVSKSFKYLFRIYYSLKNIKNDASIKKLQYIRKIITF